MEPWRLAPWTKGFCSQTCAPSVPGRNAPVSVQPGMLRLAYSASCTRRRHFWPSASGGSYGCRMKRCPWTQTGEDLVAKAHHSPMAMLRRFLSNLIPQKFHLSDNEGKELATFRQHFNPFIFRLTVTIHEGCPLSPLLVLAAGVLLVAIEGRQK